MSVAPETYQFRVRLLGISPMIWRRILVPSSTTLRELHGIFQVAMGWEGIHLFLFDVYAVRYGSFALHAANPDVSLQQLGLCKNERFSYIYDMGDHWEHEVRVCRYVRTLGTFPVNYPFWGGGSFHDKRRTRHPT
jgi:hypothetical protein